MTTLIGRLRDRWHASRLLRLACGLPAVLLLLGAALVLYRAGTIEIEELTERYQSRLREQGVEPTESLLIVKRLLHLAVIARPRALPVSYLYSWSSIARVMAARARQDDDKAAERRWTVIEEELLDVLAPRGRRIYPLAHFLKAQRLMRGGVELELAEVHLRRAMREGKAGGMPPGVILPRLAFIAVREGRQDGLEQLELASKTKRPDHAVLVGGYTLLLQQENLTPEERERALELAQQSALAVLRESLPKLRKRPETVVLRQRCALAYQLLGRHEETVRVLEEGYELLGQNSQFGSLLSRAYLRWAGSLDREKDQVRREELLRRALSTMPYDARLLKALLLLKGAEGERLREMMKTYLTGDRGSWMAYQLGTALVALDRNKEALPYLERAYQAHRKQSPAIANNLALALIGLSEPRAERALELINEALADAGLDKAPPVGEDGTPAGIRLRDTRGRVLAKLGRYNDALQDLVGAVEHVDDKHGTYRAIAEVYEKLGNRSFARAYRKRADDFEVAQRLRQDWQVWGTLEDFGN